MKMLKCFVFLQFDIQLESPCVVPGSHQNIKDAAWMIGMIGINLKMVPCFSYELFYLNFHCLDHGLFCYNFLLICMFFISPFSCPLPEAVRATIVETPSSSVRYHCLISSHNILGMGSSVQWILSFMIIPRVSCGDFHSSCG